MHFFIYNNVINDIIDYTNETENNFYDLFCFFLDPSLTSSDFSFTFFFLTVMPFNVSRNRRCSP